MLTVFDNGVGYPIANDDYYVRELASGYDEVVFNVFIRDPVYQYITEEAIIRERDQNFYLIKQIDAGEKTAKVVAQINLDDWKNTLYKDYSNESATVLETVQGILPSGWSVIDYSSIIKRRTIPTADNNKDYNVTALKILEDCANTYEVRFRFNTADKIIYIINPDGFLPEGAFATRDLNLKNLNYKGKSDSFVTRLYATGADGMTFASINDGKDYVENFSYSAKIICAYWSDDRYTDKQSLLDDATAKLAEMAQPTRSYECEVLDLANTNPEKYGFEDFSIFNVITLVDDAKNVRVDYQVVERWTYPYYPVKNKITLSTATPNIQSAIAQVVNAISSTTSGFQQIILSAINNATALITGNSGGYLVLRDSDDDGTPDELLIMNTADIETATDVWRWNKNGLGFSSHGYNGPYETAITSDGSIVANMITAGTLNGAIIRAGTITADALSVEAKNSIVATHQYLGDIFNDLSLWHCDGNDVTFGYETIDNVKYFVIDATNATGTSWDDVVYTKCGLRGPGAFNLHFVYYIDTEVTITAQRRFPVIRYHRLDSTGTWYTWKWVYPETVPANTDITWDVTMAPNENIDGNADTVFGFYPLPGCKMYIRELSASVSVDTYTTSGLDFNENGLALISEKVDANNVHDYVAYDIMTNIDRWVEYGPALSFETIDGKVYLELDGTPSTVHNSYYAGLNSDFLGQPQMHVRFVLRFAAQYTCAVDEQYFAIRYRDKDGTAWSTTKKWGTAQTFDADTDYQFDFYIIPGEEVYSGQLIEFYFHPGVIAYVSDIEITSTETAYNSAALTISPDGLSSIVRSGDIISSINQSPERVSIQAAKIDLQGDLSLRGDFKSYDADDTTNQTYAFLDSGNLMFHGVNGNLFAIASTAVYGSYAGIFFGDIEDPSSVADYTHINQEEVVTPRVYIHTDDRYDTYAWALVVEGNEKVTDLDCDVFTAHGRINQASSFKGHVNFYNFNNSSPDDVTFYTNVKNNSGGTVFVSDQRKKRNIKDLAIDMARSFIMGLKPRKFKFKKEISSSDRFHHGFIAQEVKEIMPEDWGVYCEDPDGKFIGLRYDEILADLVKVVQDQQNRIEELERRINDITDIQP